jgi:cyclic pyranopterin phosphate synthase
VVQRGVNHDQVAEMARFFRGTGATLRFIEYMDVGFKHRFDASLLVPSCETLAALSEHWSLRPADPHYRGEVARRYVYEDGQGEVGFISSMTQPFCSDCTRLRLTADGKLFGCLFAARGLDIKPYLKSVRDQAGLREAMIAFWRGREDRYSELRGAVTPAKKKVEMYRMGG